MYAKLYAKAFTPNFTLDIYAKFYARHLRQILRQAKNFFDQWKYIISISRLLACFSTSENWPWIVTVTSSLIWPMKINYFDLAVTKNDTQDLRQFLRHVVRQNLRRVIKLEIAFNCKLIFR